MVRLVNRTLKMMCKVVLGLGHMRGCAGCIWDGGGTSRRSRACQRGGDMSRCLCGAGTSKGASGTSEGARVHAERVGHVQGAWGT